MLYWYDPMKPDVHFEKSGPSPFMDMDLVPKYASQADLSGGEDENLEPQGVVIDPTLTANLGLKTAKAEAGQLAFALVPGRSARQRPPYGAGAGSGRGVCGVSRAGDGR